MLRSKWRHEQENDDLYRVNGSQRSLREWAPNELVGGLMFGWSGLLPVVEKYFFGNLSD